MTRPPFPDIRIDLGMVVLAPLEPADVTSLAQACAAIDPWRHFGYPADVLERYFAASSPAAHRYTLIREDSLAGAAVIRHPWLKGPYLEFLAVLPPHQNQGAGGAILSWMQSEALRSDRNLWVLASDFNARAIAFYERFGFEQVAPLPDVALEGSTEILLRKRIDREAPGTS